MNAEQTRIQMAITSLAELMAKDAEFNAMPHFTNDEVKAKLLSAQQLRWKLQDVVMQLSTVVQNYEAKEQALTNKS